MTEKIRFSLLPASWRVAVLVAFATPHKYTPSSSIIGWRSSQDVLGPCVKPSASVRNTTLATVCHLERSIHGTGDGSGAARSEVASPAARALLVAIARKKAQNGFSTGAPERRGRDVVGTVRREISIARSLEDVGWRQLAMPQSRLHVRPAPKMGVQLSDGWRTVLYNVL